jgi:hypothetical protein
MESTALWCGITIHGLQKIRSARVALPLPGRSTRQRPGLKDSPIYTFKEGCQCTTTLYIFSSRNGVVFASVYLPPEFENILGSLNICKGCKVKKRLHKSQLFADNLNVILYSPLRGRYHKHPYVICSICLCVHTFPKNFATVPSITGASSHKSSICPLSLSRPLFISSLRCSTCSLVGFGSTTIGSGTPVDATASSQCT